MKKNLIITLTLGLLVGLCIQAGLTPPLRAGTGITYEGYVFVGINPSFRGSILELYARRDGAFVSDLAVKLQDRPATYDRNCYSCRHGAFFPDAGETVTISIGDGSSGLRARTDPLLISGVMPKKLMLRYPLHKGTVASGGDKSFVVTWSGDAPPYDLVIREAGVAAGPVLRERGLMTTSREVSKSLLVSGKRYLLQVMGSEHEMRPARLALLHGSRFALSQFHAVEFLFE
jgi:hypothetical protein